MSDATRPWSLRTRKAKLTVIGASALLVGGIAFSPMAFGAAAPPKFPAAEIHKPTPMPDRVILTPTTTPSSSQKVTWRAETTAEFAQAEILESPRALGEVAPAAGAVTNVKAQSSTPVNTTLGYASTYHTVEFTGLKPATRYTYRVGDGTNWSEWNDFTTAAAAFQPFSFIYYGDAQNYIDSAVPRVFRQAFADRPQAKLIVNAGDLIDSANSEEQWGQWFKAGGFIDSQVNNLSITGNHEYSGSALSSFWVPQFPYPDNGPAWTDYPSAQNIAKTAYYVDYQGVRFIGLNTNVQSIPDLMAKQTAWLEGLLKDNPNKWTVVTFHHPVYSTTGTRNNPVVRAQWAPLFEKYGVDLVLQGHDHSYGRGNLKSARQSATTHNGVSYVVSVSGGKMYELNGGVNWTGNGAELISSSENTQLYQMIDVDKDQIRFEARYANGEHHDGFLIRKNDAGERTVTELVDGNTGEQVTVDKTSVEPGEQLTATAFGYDAAEKVKVYLIRTKGTVDSRIYVGTQTADALGKLTYGFKLPADLDKDSTYRVYLESATQKITSPVITVK